MLAAGYQLDDKQFDAFWQIACKQSTELPAFRRLKDLYVRPCGAELQACHPVHVLTALWMHGQELEAVRQAAAVSACLCPQDALTCAADALHVCPSPHALGCFAWITAHLISTLRDKPRLPYVIHQARCGL